MGSALFGIFRSRLLVYYAGSDVHRVQVVLSGFRSRQVGLGVGSWPSNRGIESHGIESQGNLIILHDLTQECRKNL